MDGISTNSIGSDNNRKIVIFLTDKKPKELFENEEEMNEATEAIETVAAEEAAETAEITVEETAEV